MADGLSAIITQNTRDIQKLQSEQATGSPLGFIVMRDNAQFTDSINALTGFARDSSVANFIRCNHERQISGTYLMQEGIHYGTELSSGIVQLASTPAVGSFFGAWETYCGSWYNFYWSGTTPANTYIAVKILDASGNNVLVNGGSATSFAISGISVLRQIRPMFILSSTNGGDNPTLGEYRFTYEGTRTGDYGDVLI